jgi:hypothetical protein
MKVVSRGHTVALLGAVGALCVACASGGAETSNGFTSDDGSAADVTTADVSREASPVADSAPGLDSAASSPDSSDDSTGSGTNDSSADASDGPATAESAAVDTGSSDVASETGAADASGDATSCSAGPSPSYAATCTGCSISATCLLSCESCRKKDQTMNLNPWVQLPCPGTTSVSNNDGVLVCS